MHTVTITSGKTFAAQEGEALLDAALRQQVVLDYSCRTGRCSSCKGRVRAGVTEARHDEIGLSAAELEQGFILTCVRHAKGPVELEIDDLGDIVMPEAKTLPCRIQSLDRLSADVVRVVLRLPPGSPLTFLPGQYIDVIGSEGLRRSYSVANAPREDKTLELHIREVPNGEMSQYWFGGAKANDLLRLRGPLGTFFLREQAGMDLVLLATGTGIAPVKAILEGLAFLDEAARPNSVTVYWGGRHPEDLYWTPPDRPDLRFVPVLSRAGPQWTGARGYIQQALLSDLGPSPDVSRLRVYACGSDTMIHSAQERLRAAGLPDRHFHSDAFVCSAAT